MAGETILVVEDDLALLEALRETLEIEGYAVVTASGGREALAALDHVRPDLIVSDIVMPGLDGYDFCRQVRTRRDLTAVPFIFLTARSARTDVRAAKDLGADDYITKPFEPEDLLVAIASRLRRRAEVHASEQAVFEDLTRGLVQTLGHELRTPLAQLSAYAELLESGGPGLAPGDFDDLMRGLQAGVRRLGRLVEDVVLLTDLDTGRAAVLAGQRTRALGSLADVLCAACAGAADDARVRGVSIVIDVAPDLPLVEADPVYLSEAVARLVDNAVKFSPRPGTTVRVSAALDAGGIAIRVADEGVGIPEAAVPALFAPFHQVGRESQEQQGLGNGLAICRGLVVLFGGDVDVQSRPGEGSTFTIRLPSVPC